MQNALDIPLWDETFFDDRQGDPARPEFRLRMTAVVLLSFGVGG
jgi:hypothetical protein